MKKFKKIVSLFFVSLITVFLMHHVLERTYRHEGFRFEDYSSDEEAQAALLKLHPVGTDLQALRETLENAGAAYRNNTNPNFKNDPENRTVKLYRYKKGLFGWGGFGIMIRHTENGTIEEIKVYKTYQGL